MGLTILTPWGVLQAVYGQRRRFKKIIPGHKKTPEWGLWGLIAIPAKVISDNSEVSVCYCVKSISRCIGPNPCGTLAVPSSILHNLDLSMMAGLVY